MKRLATFFLLVIFSTLLFGQANNEILTNFAFGRYSEVIEQINKQEQNTELLQLKAMAFEGLKLYDSAITCYQNLYSADSLWALKGLARCYENAGNPTKAIEVYNKILSVDSTNQQLRLNYALLLKKSLYDNQALQQFKTLVGLDSTNAKYWDLLGDQYKKMKLNIEATTAYYNANNINPNDIEVATKYYKMLTISNVPAPIVYEMVLETYQKDSTYLPLLMLKGKLESDMKKYSSSLKTFTQITTLGDSSFFTLKYYGMALHAEGYYFDAESILKKAYSLDSSDYLLNFVYAKTLTNIGESDLAVNILKRTIKNLYPPNDLIATFYESIGDVYKMRSKYNLAEKNYLKAMELNKKNELDCLSKLLQCKLNQKDYISADEIVSKYDSIATLTYANDSDQLSRAKQKVKYFKNMIKYEQFFMDEDIKKVLSDTSKNKVFIEKF
jgi:tetratricopeptide (TPR) repeat protein